jgi:hypothetical protein
MNGVQIESRIREWADARAVPSATVEKWLVLDSSSRSDLLGLAEEVKFRTGQFLNVFELLQEIALRDGQTISEILKRSPVQKILDGGGSGPGRARALIDHLRVLRFPLLMRATERLGAEVASLALPRGIKVVLPRELASDEVRIEIVAHGGAELAELLEALKARTSGLVGIAAMLAGAEGLRQLHRSGDNNDAD